MSRMREMMRNKRVAGALAAIALLLVGFRFLSLREEKPGVGPPAFEAVREQRGGLPGETPAPPPTVEAPSGALPRIDRPEMEIAWSWKRNPFLPADGTVSAGAGAGSPARVSGPEEGREISADLRGTVVAGRVGMAIFGSRLVPVGGKIGGWTVEQVEPYRVAMRRGSETRVVEMFKPVP